MKVIYKFRFIFVFSWCHLLLSWATHEHITQRSTSQSSTRLLRGKKENINERPWALSQLHASWSRRSYSGCELKSWIRNEQPHRCLSEHRSETQFPRCSTEFLVRIEEVTHTSLQRGCTGKREKKNITHPRLVQFASLIFLKVFWMCGRVGRHSRNARCISSAALRLHSLILFYHAGENYTCCIVIFPVWRGRAPANHLKMFYFVAGYPKYLWHRSKNRALNTQWTVKFMVVPSQALSIAVLNTQNF